MVHLTPAELKIVHCIAQGKSNKEIAIQYNKAYETVKNQMSNIMRKFGANNRTQVVLIAIKNGYFPDILEQLNEHSTLLQR